MIMTFHWRHFSFLRCESVFILLNVDYTLWRHIVGMSENFYRVKKSTRMYVFKQFFFFFYLSAQFFPFGFRWVSCTFNDLFRKSLRISNVFVQHYFSLKEKITVSAVSNDFFLLSSVASFFFLHGVALRLNCNFRMIKMLIFFIPFFNSFINEIKQVSFFFF